MYLKYTVKDVHISITLHFGKYSVNKNGFRSVFYIRNIESITQNKPKYQRRPLEIYRIQFNIKDGELEITMHYNTGPSVDMYYPAKWAISVLYVASRRHRNMNIISNFNHNLHRKLSKKHDILLKQLRIITLLH